MNRMTRTLDEICFSQRWSVIESQSVVVIHLKIVDLYFPLAKRISFINSFRVASFLSSNFKFIFFDKVHSCLG